MIIEKFTTLVSVPTPFLKDDVDTDVIYPGRYLKVVRRTGLEQYGFEALRFKSNGTLNPEAIFNQLAYEGSQILLVGENFGCGSSREHAVWAIRSMGFKAIVGKGFGDIFRSNCYKNGLLPIELKGDFVDWIATNIDKSEMEINLEKQMVIVKSKSFSFEISDQNKKCLIEGLDQIELTLMDAPKIKQFEQKQRSQTPWLYEDLEK